MPNIKATTHECCERSRDIEALKDLPRMIVSLGRNVTIIDKN